MSRDALWSLPTSRRRSYAGRDAGESAASARHRLEFRYGSNRHSNASRLGIRSRPVGHRTNANALGRNNTSRHTRIISRELRLDRISQKLQQMRQLK